MRSKHLSSSLTAEVYDGSLVEQEEVINQRMREDGENMNIDDDNTYDNEESQGQNRINPREVEILRRQMEIEDDEYLPCIVDLNEKLINFD